MTDYGTDVSTFPDLDPTFGDITGPRSVLECVARRFLTKRGQVEYAPGDGLDVREFLSGGVDNRKLFSLQAKMQAEAEKDERVLSASVSVTVNQERETLTAKLILELAEGPFTLTLEISKVSVEVLLP